VKKVKNNLSIYIIIIIYILKKFSPLKVLVLELTT